VLGLVTLNAMVAQSSFTVDDLGSRLQQLQQDAQVQAAAVRAPHRARAHRRGGGELGLHLPPPGAVQVIHVAGSGPRATSARTAVRTAVRERGRRGPRVSRPPLGRLGALFAALIIGSSGSRSGSRSLQVRDADALAPSPSSSGCGRSTRPPSAARSWTATATSSPCRSDAAAVYADPSQIPNPAKVAARLAPLLGKSPADLLADLHGGARGSCTWPGRWTPRWPTGSRQ